MEKQVGWKLDLNLDPNWIHDVDFIFLYSSLRGHYFYCALVLCKQTKLNRL